MVAKPICATHWVFDSAPNGKGLLWESYTGPATAKTYFRTHSYDVLSRPQQTVEQLADGQYRSSIIYDAWGRVIQQSYQRQQNATKAFATRYNKFGFAERFERGGLVLGAIKSMDAAARPTSILLGNGLLATQNYYAKTGRLDTSNLAPNGNSAQIRLAQKCEYDKLGNVTLRSQSWDANEKLTERFDYDVLNRISFSRVDNQAQQNFTYDAVGNLLSKTGVGTGSYVYPTQGVNAVRPHAPQSIPGIGSFEYDNNGNLINGAGRSITWTSFDMPLQISKGSITAKFSYGPEHNRIKQERSDGSTEIYAGAQIVEKDADGILTIKTYWPAGLGLEIDRPQVSNSELNWTHVDKLGSVIAISDEVGNFREKMAYDAWGKRRTLSGAPINGTATPDSIDGKVDHRGFTNHEMLDQFAKFRRVGTFLCPRAGCFATCQCMGLGIHAPPLRVGTMKPCPPLYADLRLLKQGSLALCLPLIMACAVHCIFLNFPVVSCGVAIAPLRHCVKKRPP